MARWRGSLEGVGVIFTPTSIDGAWIVDVERREDNRGFFARMYCHEEFVSAGLEPTIRQGNLSYNKQAGTLRGMHFQQPPHQETKLVRCTRGAVFDVIVDMRKDAPTYLTHVGVRLDQDNHRALYVPRYCAHGYLTLEPDSEVTYLVSADYTPGHAGGFRFDDPALGIEWPAPADIVSAQDRAWPLITL